MNVYLMLPLLQSTTTSPLHEISHLLQIPPSQIILHQVSPNTIAIQTQQLNIGYADIEQILQQHEENAQRVLLLENIMKCMEIPIVNEQSNVETIVKKSMKYKDLKEENRKLKKLLQTQFDNSEKVREETQKTMKILREEFDALVKEINVGKQAAGEGKNKEIENQQMQYPGGTHVSPLKLPSNLKPRRQ